MISEFRLANERAASRSTQCKTSFGKRMRNVVVSSSMRRVMFRTCEARMITLYIVFLDDRFRETGLDEASIHGTGIMLVDSSFGKI
jgi:hypothetical protein